MSLTAPRTRSVAFGRAGLVAVLVIALDLLSKHLVRVDMAMGEEHKLVLGIKLVRWRNDGVAFGILSGGGAAVLVFTFAALGVLVGYLALRPGRRWLWVPTGLLVGGAIGNLIDRLAHGAVTDFIKLPAWPAFNVADSAITVGMVLLILVIEVAARHGS
jgi:signal peptidase II